MSNLLCLDFLPLPSHPPLPCSLFSASTFPVSYPSSPCETGNRSIFLSKIFKLVRAYAFWSCSIRKNPHAHKMHSNREKSIFFALTATGLCSSLNIYSMPYVVRLKCSFEVLHEALNRAQLHAAHRISPAFFMRSVVVYPLILQ
jgi:hypothetical protein